MAGVRLISLKDELEQRDNYVTDSDLEFKDFDKNNKVLFNKLFIDDSKYKLISSSPKIFSAIHKDDFGKNFYISEAEMDYYISGFLQSVKDNVDEILKKSVADGAEDDLNKAALDDSDVKLNLYRSFKSLYDKWINSSEDGDTSGYFFNNYGKNKDERMLFDHFKFVNRANQDVGSKAAIDFTYLSNLANTQNGQGPTQSLYQSLTELLGKNNFDFWPLPANIDFTTQNMSNDDVKDMFKALDYVGDIKAFPLFLCVYVGGSSRTLADLNGKGNNCYQQKDDFNYVDDSFDLTDSNDWPEEYNNSDDNGLIIFKVRYGQEAQNHFYGLQLDQAEFKETQESLEIIDAMTNPKTGSQPNQAGKGNNMYDVYLTRSYNCTVSALGNMSIQPLMYFKLENVPMFRGTYLITGVKHTVTPHNIKTEFTGMRQPRVTVPVVTDAISLLDLSLIDVNETSTSNTSSGLNNSLNVASNYSVSDVKEFTSQEKMAKGCDIAKRLQTDLGLTLAQATGVVGNLIAESGLIPDRVQESAPYCKNQPDPCKGLITNSGGWNGTTFGTSDNLGYGWAQWTFYTLKIGFIEYADSQGFNLRTTPANDQINYGYLISWISASKSKLNELKTKTTPYEAAKYFAQQYERCGDCKKQSEWTKRGGLAQQVYDYCNGNVSV
jgi:hypothetical protein